jgi:hypothetical protein
MADIEAPRKPNSLQEHPYRTAEVTIVAHVTEPRVLQWKDPYSDDKAPKSFQPLMSEEGACMYIVPFAYAERLLRGEPYKYQLIYPKRILMNFPSKNGGTERREVFGVVPKVIGNKQVVDDNGVLVFRQRTEIEKNSVITEQRKINEGGK